MKFLTAPLITLLLIILGCAKPSLIDEDKMVVIYTDLVIAQDTTVIEEQEFSAIKEEIFSRHSVTEGEYNETLDYYNDNPERWDEFFNKAIARLEALKKAEDPRL